MFVLKSYLLYLKWTFDFSYWHEVKNAGLQQDMYSFVTSLSICDPNYDLSPYDFILLFFILYYLC